MANSLPTYNGKLVTAGSGTYNIRVMRVQLGMDISSNSGEARQRRVFYPAVSTTSSMVLTVGFPTWEAREKFSSWMNTFMEETINGRGFNAAMQIFAPTRGITRTAVPGGPLNYGESLTDMIYTVDINFIGATDPLDISGSDKKVASYYKPPKRGGGTVKYFSPAATQLSGAGALEGPIYSGTDTPGTDMIPSPNSNVFQPGTQETN